MHNFPEQYPAQHVAILGLISCNPKGVFPFSTKPHLSGCFQSAQPEAPSQALRMCLMKIRRVLDLPLTRGEGSRGGGGGAKWEDGKGRGGEARGEESKGGGGGNRVKWEAKEIVLPLTTLTPKPSHSFLDIFATDQAPLRQTSRRLRHPTHPCSLCPWHSSGQQMAHPTVLRTRGREGRRWGCGEIEGHLYHEHDLAGTRRR